MNAAIHAYCDAAQASGPASDEETGHPTWVLVATILASGLAFVDGSVVNVGLPAVGASFKATQETSNGWSTLIYCPSAHCCFWGARREIALDVCVFL